MENTQDLTACVTKLQENVLQWENRLQSEQGGPAAFRLAMNELRAALDEIGRTGFLRLAHACEVASDTLGNDGRLYRFKQDESVGQGRSATSAVSGRPWRTEPGAAG